MAVSGGEFDPILEKFDPGIARGLTEARSKRGDAIPKKMVEPGRILKDLSTLPKAVIKGSLPHFPGTASYKAEQVRLDEDHRQLVEDAIRRYPSAQKEADAARRPKRLPSVKEVVARQKDAISAAETLEMTEKDILPNKLPHFPGSVSHKKEQVRLAEERRQREEDAVKRYPSAQKEARQDSIEVSDEDLPPLTLPHFPGSPSYKAEQARLQKERRAKLKEALPRGLPKMPKKMEVAVEDDVEELSDAYLDEHMVEVVDLPSSVLEAVPPSVPKEKPRPVQRLFGFVKNFFTSDKKAA